MFDRIILEVNDLSSYVNTSSQVKKALRFTLVQHCPYDRVYFCTYLQRNTPRARVGKILIEGRGNGKIYVPVSLYCTTGGYLNIRDMLKFFFLKIVGVLLGPQRSPQFEH